MLTLAYLTYLYNDFLIERLLVRHDPHGSTQLLDVSMNILSTVLTVARHREHTVNIQRDFISAVGTSSSYYRKLLIEGRYYCTAFPVPAFSSNLYKSILAMARLFHTQGHGVRSSVT